MSPKLNAAIESLSNCEFKGKKFQVCWNNGKYIRIATKHTKDSYKTIRILKLSSQCEKNLMRQ